MRILVLDRFYQLRDLAQMDIYAAMRRKYNVFHVAPSEVLRWYKDCFIPDVLWLGIYHQDFGIDLSILPYLQGDRLTVIDQADNEEFLERIGYMPYMSFRNKVLLSRYLPNKAMAGAGAVIGCEARLMPWYVDASRFTARAKDIDVAFVCSMYGRRDTVADSLRSMCGENGWTHHIGEAWGHEYADVLSRARVLVVESGRKAFTQKYIEGVLSGCSIVGDMPVFPINNIVMRSCDLDNFNQTERAITKALRTGPPDNAHIIAEYCDPDKLKIPF